jgi:PAS domain S-box-containing protein
MTARRVLLAVDDPDQCRRISEALEELAAEYTVEFVEGEEVPSRLETDEYHCVLTVESVSEASGIDPLDVIEEATSEANADAPAPTSRIYERIFDTMQQGACLYDRDGRFQVVNEHLAETYGTDPDALVGEPSQLISHVRQSDPEDPFRRALEGDRVEGEAKIDTPGKGTVTLEYQMTPLVVGSTVEGVVCVTNDVTEQRKRERALERARSEYQELINGMNDTAWVIGLDEQFLAVNDAAVETLGYTREELIGMSPHDIDASRDEGDLSAGNWEHDEISELIQDMPEDEIQVFETVHETKRGEFIPVEISSSLISYHGETAILSIGRDISERKDRERRLEEFASFVSHDLRNPLNVAQGHLSMAREQVSNEHLDVVDRSLERMGALISDLLSLAREGGQVQETQRMALRDVVERSWENVDTGDATLVIDVDTTILADESRLQQLFENLVRNAVEHGGGDVTVTVGGLEDGFFLADDGPGIPPEEREKAFDAGWTTKDGGTGFGLRIVEQVVEAHGWECRLRDSDDGGLRVEISGVERI